MATDDEVAEWHRPGNWRGGALGIYHAPRDARVWVPKRNPSRGWTLNFARRAAWGWLVLLLGAPLALAVAAVWRATR